ncbi:nucleotide sugar dehydrogenase [Candidatus Viadribacter manganicus]|uniref:GDP-mannose dehydrogenase n=1 Tax=Candidatus Viadribacter manganicus TaxID=1759059 RepID=A0A1B1AJS0_9PROT|nr:nucleotide sugar dehydrogenase [Candidatus Viadribacter manganicus]ANP46804.1 GDP-mannose dehydrogenase [Candidatus Viadribacter manganicus]
MNERRRIAVIGLGYVGLPAAVAFARKGFSVIGFEIDASRVAELREGKDRTREVTPEELKSLDLYVTTDVEDLKRADFFIVTVPTPIDDALVPDLSAVHGASHTVGKALKKGDIVVYESTVYPGCTEDECGPILEKASGLKSGVDFTLGFSPERINPGDHLHRFETIVKVVSGSDARTLDIVAETYGAVVTAGVHRAPSIKVAEAAKVIENTQRDINIALMNELALINGRLGLDTGDVLAAARTKWNFLGFTPGLVGGHCIGVDPYYLTHKAQQVGYHPQVVLAGRRVNDSIGPHIGRECVRLLNRSGKSNPRVAVLGVTFKEDVPDVRNSKVYDIVNELRSFGIDVVAHDPYADAHVSEEHGAALTPFDSIGEVDAVIVAVSHKEFRDGGWPMITKLLRGGAGVVMDVRGFLDRSTMPSGINLWRL